MKILFILEHYWPYIGGVEKLFYKLAERLVEQGHTVRVITTKFSPELDEHQVVNGVEIIRIPLKNRYVFTFFGFLYCFKHSKGFDLVHTTSYNAALPAYITAKFRRIPALITFHEIWGSLWFSLPYLHSIERFLFYIYEQFVIRLPFSLFIGVSKYTESALLKYHNRSSVSMIYNGLDYETPRPNERSNREFLFFGRLGVSKGIDILLGACKILEQKQIDFSLTMVIPKVPKQMYNRVKTIIAKSSFEDRIIIKHNLSDEQLKDEILRVGKVIIPSYSEGFCFAAAEVCSLQVGLIHSGKGALPEVVSGKTIQMKDFSDIGLSNAMIQALENKWNRIPPKQFPLSQTVDNYLKLYRNYTGQ